MNLHYTLPTLLLSTALICGCSSDLDEMEISGMPENQPELVTPSAFAPADKSRVLFGNGNQRVKTLLQDRDTEFAKGLGEIEITPEQIEEIKIFTDDLVKGAKNETEVHKIIFDWLHKEIHYVSDYEEGLNLDNNPYPVFKTHKAICQGFANLLHVMLHTQNILCLNVNGFVRGAGHAWNYVYADGIWMVSDVTNNGYWPIEKLSSYKHLDPQRLDAPLYETDEVIVYYSDFQLNIEEIKTTNTQFVVPFSVGGFRITSLNPHQVVSEGIREIYIGKNIETLGEYYKGLEKNALGVEQAYVEEGNKKMVSHSGAVYKKNGNEVQLYYLPARLKKFELMPMKILDKNTVFMHEYLEEVIIPTGTKELADYAFEKCPSLRKAYVPNETKVSENAFMDVHPEFEIIRGDYTGIPEIRI